MAAFTGEGRGIIHLLFDDAQAGAPAGARGRGHGRRRQARGLVIDIEDRPGTLGGCPSLGEAGVNIELAYTTFGGVKLVVATDDLEPAPRVAGRLSAGYAVTSRANASKARGSAPGRSSVWAIESVHSSSTPGVMKMPWFMW